MPVGRILIWDMALYYTDKHSSDVYTDLEEASSSSSSDSSKAGSPMSSTGQSLPPAPVDLPKARFSRKNTKEEKRKMRRERNNAGVSKGLQYRGVN